LAWLTVRLYRRTRSVVPLIVGHVGYDLLGLADDRVRIMVVLCGIALVYLFVVEWRQQRASEAGSNADDGVAAGRLS